jgi:hypothetical protein
MWLYWAKYLMWLYWAKYIMWLYWAMTGQEKGDQVTTRADLTVHKKISQW